LVALLPKGFLRRKIISGQTLRFISNQEENYVVKHLLSHIWQIIGIGKTCESINELREKVALHFKTKPVQLRLDLPKRGNGR
jgi:hypothetical protein